MKEIVPEDGCECNLILDPSRRERDCASHAARTKIIVASPDADWYASQETQLGKSHQNYNSLNDKHLRRQIGGFANFSCLAEPPASFAHSFPQQD